MQAEAENFIENVVKLASKEIVERGMEHDPMVFIQTEDGYKVSFMNFEKQEDKIRYRDALKKVLIEYDSDFYVMVCETYVIKRKRFTKRTPKPSEAKDRKEMLMISANTRDGKLETHLAEIKSNGKRKLGQFRKLEGKTEDSIFRMEW